MTSFRAAALLLSCMVACAAIPAARARVHQVQPFTTVTSCVPYNVQIIPGPRYTVAVDADADVEGALTANVTDKVLYLGSGAFNTSNPIVVNVTLPATALAGVVQGGGLASIFVAPGFNGSSLSVQAGLGPGDVVVSGGNYSAVDLQNAGTGALSVAGTFGNVSLTASGITETTISGAIDKVTLTLSGISNVYVISSNPRVFIAGTANGITSVQYNQGICGIPSAFPFSSVCQLNPALAPPVTPVVPWSSNLNAVGSFICVPAVATPTITAGGTTTTTGTTATGTTSSSTTVAGSTSATAGVTPTTVAAPGIVTPSASSSASATGVPPSTAMAGGAVPLSPQVAPVPVPAPEPEAEVGGPYNFASPTPGGFQSQSGSVTPTGTNANAAAQGTNSASASAVAGPGGASTQTSNDGTTNSFNTGG